MPSVAFPELDRPRNLIRLLRFGNAGVGLAEHALLGVARQKHQNALLAAAAAGNVVFLQRLDGGVVRSNQTSINPPVLSDRTRQAVLSWTAEIESKASQGLRP